jgi:hypothetical protein
MIIIFNLDKFPNGMLGDYLKGIWFIGIEL